MKNVSKFNKVLMMALLTVPMIITSCKKEDDETTPSNPGGDKVIVGQITADETWTSNNTYILTGGVHVLDGVTLTIEAGTKIISNVNEPSVAYLLFERGSKIMAEGSKDAPIVFTSGEETPGRGDWGGIIICGKAPINNGTEAVAEVGDVMYGGSVSADNSGVLRYVRVEYTGNAINSEKEHNGFTFNGVGSGTTVEYLQAYMGNDDGYEFFGGTVNAKYLVSTGSKDDSFDWTFGWRGNGQFWLAQQANDIGDRGIEADNNGSDNSASPYSEPTLSNVVLLGADDGDGENQGMKLREGTKGKFYNVVVQGFPKRGIQVEHDVTLDNMEAGDLMVKSTINANTATPWKYTDSNGDDFLPTSPFENDATNANTTSPLTSGYIGISSSNATDPTTLGSWFSAGNYIGAVEASNDWTAGWTRSL